jgi:hypothetical protein
MLVTLIRKCGTHYPNFEEDIMLYLLRTINQNSNYKIGILVMPMLNRSMPLYEYLQTTSSGDERTRKAQLVSNVVNLLLFMKVIHMDLHLNNALRVANKLYIIDYGRASDLHSGRGDEYFKPKSKFTILSDISILEIEFRKMKEGTPTSQQKVQFMKDVIHYVWEQEKRGNIGKYGRPINNPFSQMKKWVPSLNDAIYENAYDILVSDTTDKSDAISYNQIKNTNSFNFGLPARDYYVTLPPYIKDVEITGNPQQLQQQVQQVQKLQPNKEWTTMQKGLTAAFLIFILYKCFPKGGSKQIMFGGKESTIEEIREYIKNNKLESMIIEMGKTDTCPIGENAEYARKLYEMLSSIPEEKQSEIILFPNDIRGGRRTRKTRRSRRTRKTRRR